MELVENNEISKISVSELASKALVNRSTFYLHYTDVQSVAADIENEISERISSSIEDFAIDDIYGSIHSLFVKLTNRLEENQCMKRYIIFSTNSDYILSKLKDIFVEKTKKSILALLNISEKDMEYPLTYAAAGIIDCYAKWVRDDSSTPIENVIREVSRITEHIISTITHK